MTHAARLVAAVAEEDAPAARRLVADLAAEPGGDGVEQALDGLARQAAQGSALAVELLVEVLDRFGVARRAVRRFILDEASLDDVTQDTLITTVGAITSFRGEAKFTTWLYQLARRRATDHFRRQRATVPLDDRDPSQDAAVRISSLVASREAVRRLLLQLPAPYQAAVTLRDVERLSYAEVAERLGLNLNTVKSHIRRGRDMLAAKLTEERGA